MLAALAAPKLVPLVESRFGGAAATAAGPRAAGRDGQAFVVDGLVVEPMPLTETVSTTGSLLAAEQVDLQAEVGGRIVAINFREGGRVSKGDLLIKLTDADLQATRAATEREYELAVRRERRAAELLEQKFLRQEDYDSALSALQVLEARLALTEAHIARTEIRAPFDGVAGLRYVSEGAVVGAATRIATLQSTDSLKLEFSVPERYADRIRPGDSIEFAVAGSDERHSGVIYARDPMIDTATRTLIVRALCENRDGRLLPGAFATVTVTVGHSDDALLIPSSALIPDMNGAYVLVHVDGSAERRSVTVGVRTDARVQITSGLAPGDIVITSGLLQLRPGMPVAVNLHGALSSRGGPSAGRPRGA